MCGGVTSQQARRSTSQANCCFESQRLCEPHVANMWPDLTSRLLSVTNCTLDTHPSQAGAARGTLAVRKTASCQVQLLKPRKGGGETQETKTTAGVRGGGGGGCKARLGAHICIQPGADRGHGAAVPPDDSALQPDCVWALPLQTKPVLVSCLQYKHEAKSCAVTQRSGCMRQPTSPKGE